MSNWSTMLKEQEKSTYTKSNIPVGVYTLVSLIYFSQSDIERLIFSNFELRYLSQASQPKVVFSGVQYHPS